MICVRNFIEAVYQDPSLDSVFMNNEGCLDHIMNIDAKIAGVCVIPVGTRLFFNSEVLTKALARRDGTL